MARASNSISSSKKKFHYLYHQLKPYPIYSIGIVRFALYYHSKKKKTDLLLYSSLFRDMFYVTPQSNMSFFITSLQVFMGLFSSNPCLSTKHKLALLKQRSIDFSSTSKCKIIVIVITILIPFILVNSECCYYGYVLSIHNLSFNFILPWKKS